MVLFVVCLVLLLLWEEGWIDGEGEEIWEGGMDEEGCCKGIGLLIFL